MDDAQALQDNGWRQGSILPLQSLPSGCSLAPALPELTADSLLLVLTQDCDLVQPDFSKEPFAEVLLATPVAGSPDGNFFHGKNPRLIQFLIGDLYFQACCHHRSRLDRRVLAQCSPSAEQRLGESDIGLLREWMAKRYVRPAFPDNLNRRIRGGTQGKAIQKLLEAKGHLFQDLYLFCSPADTELSEDQPYRISLWLAVTTESAQNKSLLKEADETCREMTSALRNCPGIELLTCEVRAEGQISLDDLRFFKPWDFDYLTHREAVQPS